MMLIRPHGMNDDKNRVCFFSKQDMSWSYYLAIAEPILRNYKDNEHNVNDIIEFHQIKLYFDNEIFLPSWTNKDILQFKETIVAFWANIYNFWEKINDNNVIGLIDAIEFGYHHAFWSLTEQLETYKNISENVFVTILNSDKLQIRDILQRKKLSVYFKNSIREYLLKYEKAAELLLAEFVERHNGSYSKMYFPENLSIIDKEQIVINYLNSLDTNINFVRLILNSRNNQLFLSDRTRFMALKLEKKMNNEILENGVCLNYGCEISFSYDQKDPVQRSYTDNIQKESYSMQWIVTHSDKLSLFHNFSLLFTYIDQNGLISLVSKGCEIGLLEILFMKSKNEYSTGTVFSQKDMTSLAQLIGYSNILRKINISIESIITYFIREYLDDNYCIHDYRITFPSDNATNLEKVRMIAPEFESILKQYKLYVCDGNIDHELKENSSIPGQVKEIPSLVSKKYFYGTGEKFEMLKYLFFSDQCNLILVKPSLNKYNNFCELIIHENLLLDHFKQYQRPTIDHLISENYLEVNTSGFVKIQKLIEVFIIKELFYNDCGSYWHYNDEIRSVVDDMQNRGMVYFKQTLFSEPEQKYFNFFLNKKDFTNGLDLRNRYMHGTNSASEAVHQNSYYIYLRLLILAILKIEDDLFLKQLQNNF
jgi:hypothetical protein